MYNRQIGTWISGEIITPRHYRVAGIMVRYKKAFFLKKKKKKKRQKKMPFLTQKTFLFFSTNKRATPIKKVSRIYMYEYSKDPNETVALYRLCITPYHTILTHLCRIDSSTSTLWTGLFPIQGCLVSFLLLPCLIGASELNANIVDPEQMPQSAASDLGLHCLRMSLLWDARLIWVKV